MIKKYQTTILLLLLLAAAALIPAASASDLSLSGPSSIIAGNDFTLSVAGGNPLGTVTLSMTSGDRPDLQLLPGQVGVSGSAGSASVVLDASGRARVEYTTQSGGEESTCRFSVSDGSSSDTTSVTITRGTVSATAVSTPRPASNTYPIGSEITLSGAAPGTSKVYLFMTGPNLPAGGVKLSNPSVASVTGDPDTFDSRPVNNNMWTYKWQTSGRLDPGTYTIYAVDRPANRYSLSDASYSTYSVTLTRPGMTAGVYGGIPETSATAATPVPTEPVVIGPEEPVETPVPSIWDQIAAWFSGLFRASAAEPVGYVLKDGAITISGETIFSTEKEFAVSIEPYFTAAPKGSAELSGWSGVVPVVAGAGGINVWSATAAVSPGNYIVTVEPIGGGQMMSWEITVVDA
ncbi:hypothetical protein [Methanorbis furvi]|uniref:DUF3821 domain-containing protein n=1 Tax=Methanorbis furvi TaxID=3028299 RepID=A0AAE4S979_9EURY|nr:hypothetical protein [Methanocorpusculaceae archaeon Ag1]